MKSKQLLRMLIFISFCFQANAQTSGNGGVALDPKLQAEIQRESTGVVNSGATQGYQTQQMYQQPLSTSTLQQQPTTFVEASPLVQSRAEQIRKMRQEAELATEQRIVEKLEATRLEDEANRMKRIFGDNLNNQQTLYPTSVPAVTPVQPVQAAPVAVQAAPVVEAAPQPNLEDMRAGLLESVKADLKKEQEDAEKSRLKNKYFISGTMGMADYRDLSQVKNQALAGISLGAEFENHSIVEFSFNYSEFSIPQVTWMLQYEALEQFNFAVAAKYAFLEGRVRPNVGGLLSYTYRRYTGPYFNAGAMFQPPRNTADSTAFDYGIAVGLDVDINEKFAVGLDYRYLMNLNNNRDGYLSQISGANLLEEANYQIVGIFGKFKF